MRKRMTSVQKERFVFITAAIITYAFLFIASPALAQQPYNLRIAGGSPGSSVQVSAAGLSLLINERTNKIRAQAVGSDGATANIRMVESGETGMGGTATTGLYLSLKGFKNEKPYKNWRGVCPQGGVPLFAVTRKGSGITKMADIQGKRASLGPAGSGVGGAYAALLPALGLSGEFKHMPFSESNQRLTDGLLDVFLLGVRRLPASVETEAMLGDKAVWFGISDPKMQEKALAAIPALGRITLPAGTYKTQTEPMNTIGYSLWIIAHHSVPDWVVKDVLDMVVNHGKTKLSGYGAWQEAWLFNQFPGFQDMAQIGGFLHPGAVAFWKAKGVNVPANVIPSK